MQILQLFYAVTGTVFYPLILHTKFDVPVTGGLTQTLIIVV